jgi:hypothetical protein
MIATEALQTPERDGNISIRFRDPHFVLSLAFAYYKDQSTYFGG